MQTFKQGTAALALVASLGLVIPASFGGPVSADKAKNRELQPMTIECAALGGSVIEVVAFDHDPGGRMANMREVNGSRVFVPWRGSVNTTYTAVENNEVPGSGDDSQAQARVALAPSDSRLAGGYPTSFEIPPGHPYAYFGEGFRRKGKPPKNLIDCTVIDVGKADDGTTCLKNGLLQEECFDNVFVAGEGDAAQEDCLVEGVEQDTCMVEDVAYHYTDFYSIKAKVKGKAASNDVDHENAGRQHKGNRGGKHRGKN